MIDEVYTIHQSDLLMTYATLYVVICLVLIAVLLLNGDK
jgi:hypothetical protein